MIKVLTWNIQCGLGMDGRIDLRRIADVIRRMGDFDVICLQEVSRFDASVTGDSSEADQAHAIGNLFNGYGAFFGAAIDRLNADGKTRRQFGNMILSRLPVIQTFNFQLPQPIPEAPCKHMPRQAIEVAVAAHGEPIRITLRRSGWLRPRLSETSNRMSSRTLIMRLMRRRAVPTQRSQGRCLRFYVEISILHRMMPSLMS